MRGLTASIVREVSTFLARQVDAPYVLVHDESDVRCAGFMALVKQLVRNSFISSQMLRTAGTCNFCASPRANLAKYFKCIHVHRRSLGGWGGVPPPCNIFSNGFLATELKRDKWKHMRRLTTGIRSEKCVVRRFRRCANVIDCTYTNLDSTV